MLLMIIGNCAVYATNNSDPTVKRALLLAAACLLLFAWHGLCERQQGKDTRFSFQYGGRERS